MFRVLLVDDEPWDLLGMEKGFPWSETGFSVIGQTTNPVEALDIILKEVPDVIFTDIRMPEISGIELIKKARENNIKSEFIIVKERVEDMFNLEDELGYVDDTFCEQKICYAWVGYNKDICVKGHPEYEYGLCSRCECSKCRVKSARYEQYNYPVVVITHERLFRNANTQEFIENLKTWRNEHGVIHKRQYIIIDERPKFFASYKKILQLIR
jgi:CheY-like chemotaxis protein